MMKPTDEVSFGLMSELPGCNGSERASLVNDKDVHACAGCKPQPDWDEGLWMNRRSSGAKKQAGACTSAGASPDAVLLDGHTEENGIVVGEGSTERHPVARKGTVKSIT